MTLRRWPRRWNVTRRRPGYTRRTVAGKARARSGRRPAPCPHSGIAGRGAIASRSESLMRIHRARRKRAQRHDCASCNRHMRVPVSRGQARIPQRIVPVHRDHRNRPVPDWPVRRERSRNRPIPSGRKADIGAAIKTRSPPRPAATHPGRPSPTEAVVEIPCPALVRRVAPRVAGRPHVAVRRRIHPLAVSVGIEVGVRRFIWRPDITLPRHIVPTAAGIQIVPCRVLRFTQILGRPRLICRFGRQCLVAIGVPRIPGIRLDRFGKGKLTRVGWVERDVFAAMQIGSDEFGRGRSANLQVYVS